MMKKLNKNNLKHALDPLVCGKGKKGLGEERQDRAMSGVAGWSDCGSSLESCAGSRWRRVGGS